jgi:hypothetical protein
MGRHWFAAFETVVLVICGRLGFGWGEAVRVIFTFCAVLCVFHVLFVCHFIVLLFLGCGQLALSCMPL